MKKKILFIFILFSIFFIPKVVLATSSIDRIHFIKNESGAGDAIVIESNGHFGLVDTMSPGPTSPLATVDNSLVNNTDNGTKVYNYLKNIGCTYLDFVVITHNHADHNGGISELQELVTSDTIVFYKEDIKVTDDVEEALGMNNHEAYLAELNYLNSRNAIKCNVLSCNPSNISNSFISNIVKENKSDIDYNVNLKKRIVFNFGDYNINLYNLYTLSNHAENLNSIITHIVHTPSDKSALLMGDLDSSLGDKDYNYPSTVSHLINDPIELGYDPFVGIDSQMALIIEGADILKAANQADDTSNSYYLLRTLKPSHYIIPDVHFEDEGGLSPQRKAVSTVLIARRTCGADSYYTSQSDGAIVAEFGSDSYTIKNFNSLGSETSNTMTTISAHISSSFDTGWFDANYALYSDRKLMYLNGGSVTTGRTNIDGNWFTFDGVGIMYEGFSSEDNSLRYYIQKKNADANHVRGAMALGFMTIDNKYYYFRTRDNDISAGAMGTAVEGWNTINNNLYYFRTHDNEISSGEQYTAILGFAVIGGDKYYFRTIDNDVSNGPMGSALRSACVKVGNKRYCFDENAHVSSENTIVDVPTTATMCNKLQYNGEEQVLTKDALDGYIWGENLGTNIGFYQVTATLDGDEYIWSDDTTEDKTITCEIDRIKINKPVLVSDSFDYVGVSYTPIVSGYDGKIMEKTGTHSAINAGTYSITVGLLDTTMMEWEDGTDTSIILNWVINKAYTDVPIVHDVEEYYDGEPHTVIIDSIDNGTLKYSLNATDWSETIPTRTIVGETVIYAKIFGDSNYEDSDVSQGTITILKSPAANPIVTNYRGKCDGEPHSITAVAPSNGTIYYSTDNENWSTTNPYRIDVGVTTVYVKVDGDDNHDYSEVVIGEIRLLGEDEYAINEYDYSDEDGIVYGVKAGTTCAQFKSKVVAGYGYQVTVDCTQSNVVYTGGKVRIKEGNTLIKEYSIVVVGDANGDGSVGILDYIKIRKDIMDTERLGPIYAIAADMNKNQEIDIIDYIRIRKIIMEEE